MKRTKYVLLALTILSVTMTAVPAVAGAPAARHLNLADTYRGIPFQHADDVTLSADGRFLYASHFLTGLSVLGRNAADESFEMLASYFTRGGGDLFESVSHFTLSPDEAYLYVLGSESDAVAVLVRDPMTGLLSQVQTLVPGEGGIPAFTDPSSLVVSPLGDFAYLAVRNSDALRLLVLARDPATGRLSFVQDFIAPETDVFRSQTSELLISPDGEHLYSLGSPVAAVFERDLASGRLAFIEAFDSFSDGNENLVSTYDGAFSPDGSTLYLRGANPCYNSCYRQALAMLRRDPASGRLEFLGYAPGSVLTSLMALALSPDGRHLYLPDNEDKLRIAIYRRDPGTGWLEPTGEYRVRPDSRYSRIYSTTFGDGGRTLYASGFERRPLALLDRDPVSGALSFDPVPAEDGAGLVGIADLAAAPDGQLYVAGYLSEAISRFDWDDAGSLEPRAVSFAGEPGMEDLREPFKLRLSTDGGRLFALDDRGVASLKRDPTGDLELTGRFDPESVIGATFGLEVSPDGAHLYLPGYRGTMVLSRELELIQALEDIAFRDLAAGPEGRFVYGLANLDCSEFADCRALMIFSRDPENGLLTLRGTVSGPDSTAFEEPRSLVLSPDGGHLYVTSIQGGSFSISAFARNPGDGSLEFIEILSDGEPTEETHFGQEDLAIAPDGRHLYALRVRGNDLTVYEREASSGRLTLLETLTGDELGSALTDATSLAVSADSQRIFVAGGRSAALTTFSRRCLTEAGLCLNQQRFRVDVKWRSFDGTTGSASVVPAGTDDSGLLWFFDAGNWEMLIKVLDGCGLNDRFWVFAAATTTVEYTLRVTDTLTGAAREYFSPLGTAAAAITDTDAFASCATGVAASPPVASVRQAVAKRSSSKKPATAGPPSKSACVPSATRLCLSDDRFSVEVTWHDYAGATGPGRVANVGSDDSGLLWFFDAGNWEMLIKVLDGCAINGRFWLLAASTTDVGYSLRVTDTETQVVQEYHNPLGTAAPALVDVFDVCR